MLSPALPCGVKAISTHVEENFRNGMVYEGHPFKGQPARALCFFDKKTGKKYGKAIVVSLINNIGYSGICI